MQSYFQAPILILFPAPSIIRISSYNDDIAYYEERCQWSDTNVRVIHHQTVRPAHQYLLTSMA